MMEVVEKWRSTKSSAGWKSSKMKTKDESHRWKNGDECHWVQFGYEGLNRIGIIRGPGSSILFRSGRVLGVVPPMLVCRSGGLFNILWSPRIGYRGGCIWGCHWRCGRSGYVAKSVSGRESKPSRIQPLRSMLVVAREEGEKGLHGRCHHDWIKEVLCRWELEMQWHHRVDQSIWMTNRQLKQEMKV